MYELSIKGQEIKKLKDQLAKIQEKKLKIDSAYLGELQKTHDLTQKIDAL